MKHPDKITSPPGGYKYTQPETGASFHYYTWNEVLTAVWKHRVAMGLDTTWDWQLRFEHEFCLQNPHLACHDDSIASSEDSPIAVAGRILWQSLHEFTSQYPESPSEQDKSNARYWMANWTEKIPKFGCNCRSDWGNLVASFPPDYSSREKLYRWSVVAHDFVNRKLLKPLHNKEWFNGSPAKDIG